MKVAYCFVVCGAVAVVAATCMVCTALIWRTNDLVVDGMLLEIVGSLWLLIAAVLWPWEDECR